MKKRPGLLLGFVVCYLWAAHCSGQPQKPQAGGQTQGGKPTTNSQEKPAKPDTLTPEEKRRREQPGATQGLPTTIADAEPKFNMDYFVGEWSFESNLAESPLGTGGPMSGAEVVRNVWDGRFWDISIKGENPDGAFTGKGVIIYENTFAGQNFVRYEVTQGISLLKTGLLGCDLGGTCSLHFETPPFQHNGSTIRLRGRYTLASPYSYRVTTEIRVDKDEYRNLGTVWYRRDERAKLPTAIK